MNVRTCPYCDCKCDDNGLGSHKPDCPTKQPFNERAWRHMYKFDSQYDYDPGYPIPEY